MTRNKAFEHLYGFYLYMHHHGIPLREMADFEKEEWEKMGKDLEILDILKRYVEVEYDKGEETYWLKVCKYGGTLIDKEKYNDLKEWLDGKV